MTTFEMIRPMEQTDTNALTAIPDNLSWTIGRRELFELVYNTWTHDDDAIMVRLARHMIAFCNQKADFTVLTSRPLSNPSSLAEDESVTFLVKASTFASVIRGKTAQLLPSDNADDVKVIDFQVIKRDEFPLEDDQSAWVKVQFGRFLLHRKIHLAHTPWSDIDMEGIAEPVDANILLEALVRSAIGGAGAITIGTGASRSGQRRIGRLVEDNRLSMDEFTIAKSHVRPLSKLLRGNEQTATELTRSDQSLIFWRAGSACILQKTLPVPSLPIPQEEYALIVNPAAFRSAVASIFAQIPAGTKDEERLVSITFQIGDAFMSLATRVSGGVARISCPILAIKGDTSALENFEISVSASALRDVVAPMMGESEIELYVLREGQFLVSKQTQDSVTVRTGFMNVSQPPKTAHTSANTSQHGH